MENINKNKEYYSDPTFSKAYSNIQKKKKREERGETYIPWVYIASPYRGDVGKNIIAAKQYTVFAIRQNKLPMCPHIYFTQLLDDDNETERKKGLSLALHMLKRCKELWVFGSIISSGMKKEIRSAERWNIPVRYFSEECMEVDGK